MLQLQVQVLLLLVGQASQARSAAVWALLAPPPRPVQRLVWLCALGTQRVAALC